MLPRNTFCILMTMGFVLSVFLTDVMGENLIKYNESEDGTVSYYDKDSIKRKSGIVKVWIERRFDIFIYKTEWLFLLKEDLEEFLNELEAEGYENDKMENH